jgi:hypothetical protein
MREVSQWERGDIFPALRENSGLPRRNLGKLLVWLSLKVFCHTYTRVCHYFIVEPPAGARGFQVAILNSSFENN